MYNNCVSLSKPTVTDRVKTMDKIKNSYKKSKNIYDSVLTQKGFWGRLYIRLFWGGVDDNKIAGELLSRIPDDFSGRLLDVPVGTAVFTQDKYKKLKNADIVCLDYSADMLELAAQRLSGLDNIGLVRGDVGKLPCEDESFDFVLSMNGFHAFPDKEKAFSEVYRVLKHGGRLLSCFYISGKYAVTDRLVKYILAPAGWFTPPFETEESLRTRLSANYDITAFYTNGPMVWFCAEKR